MPYRNEHAARVKNPKQFDRFARKNVSEGIDIILGIKNGKSTVQAYRFKKSKFTVDDAKAWLKEKGIKIISFEKAIEAMNKTISLVSLDIIATDQLEIIEMISPDDLARIKESDPHPFFQLYSFAHEGTSRPHVKGEENPPLIEWPRKAIESIKNFVLKGIKLFKNHRKKGESERKVIGEVVASKQKEIDGKLHHLIVSYHPPDMREEAKKCDACSQEASWDFIPQAGKWVADKLKKLKAIAGLNSKEDRPAFAGAVRLAAIEAAHIYCKEDSGKEDHPGKGKGELTKMAEMELGNIKFQTLKTHLKEERRMRPSDFFTEDELKEDRNFSHLFSDLDDLKKKIEDATKQIETLETEKNEYTKKERITTAKTRAEKIIEEMKIENEVIKKELMTMAETTPDFEDDKFKEHAGGLIEIENRLKQSIEDKTRIPEGSGDNKNDLDLEDPKNNPFLM